jgi:hypothetical protein
MLEQTQVEGHVLQFPTSEAACGYIQGLTGKIGNRFHHPNSLRGKQFHLIPLKPEEE